MEVQLFLWHYVPEAVMEMEFCRLRVCVLGFRAAQPRGFSLRKPTSSFLQTFWNVSTSAELGRVSRRGISGELTSNRCERTSNHGILGKTKGLGKCLQPGAGTRNCHWSWKETPFGLDLRGKGKRCSGCRRGICDKNLGCDVGREMCISVKLALVEITGMI